MSSNTLPLKDVKQLLEHSKYITILSHINPDADTLGTALGIYALLKEDKSKKIEVVNASRTLPHNLDFLPNFKKIKHKIDYSNSMIITCDCGSIDRLGFDLSNRMILNIDHHQSNTRFGNINIVIPEYASASQVAYTLLKEIYPIGSDAATCFYTALLSDTKFFTSRSVNKEVFCIAKALVSKGVRPDEVAYHLTQRRSLASLRILEKALASLSLYEEAMIAVVYVTQEDMMVSGAQMDDMEGIVDYVKALATVEVSLFAMEFKESIRISLRSKHVDISQVAVAFGGGGHKLAAGFSMEECTLAQGIRRILEKIEAFELLKERC